MDTRLGRPRDSDTQADGTEEQGPSRQGLRIGLRIPNHSGPQGFGRILPTQSQGPSGQICCFYCWGAAHHAASMRELLLQVKVSRGRLAVAFLDTGPGLLRTILTPSAALHPGSAWASGSVGS